MKEPLYHVGQDVAVCGRNCSVVIPITRVINVKWYPQDEVKGRAGNLWNRPAGYCYQVQAMPITNEGYPQWFIEPSLRPINPDTEYLEEELKITAKS